MRSSVPPRNGGEPPTRLIGLQLAVGLAAIVGGAHLFVEEMIHVAKSIGVEPLVLSLILAPLATELPEKANSFFWVREGKDSLALGNITGAMVFQSTIPIAFGLAAGLAVALLASRVIASMLAGIGPRDPVAIADAVAVLLGSALVAVIAPARRAAAADPANILRT